MRLAISTRLTMKASSFTISRLRDASSPAVYASTGVAARHARLASGWRAAPLPGGSRTRWIATRGFSSCHPPLQLTLAQYTFDRGDIFHIALRPGSPVGVQFSGLGRLRNPVEAGCFSGRKIDRFTGQSYDIFRALCTLFRLRFIAVEQARAATPDRRRHAVDPDTIAGADAGQVIGGGDEGRALPRRPAPYGPGGPRPRAQKVRRARAQQPRAQQRTRRAGPRRNTMSCFISGGRAILDSPGTSDAAATALDGRYRASRLWNDGHRCAPCPHRTAATGSSIRGNSGGLKSGIHLDRAARLSESRPPRRAGPYPGRHCMVCVRA